MILGLTLFAVTSYFSVSPLQDAFNAFHAHESLLALWSTYLALELAPCNTGVLLIDHFNDQPPAPTPFLDFIEEVFAPVHGVQRMAEASAREYHLCFSRLILPVDPAFHFDIPYNGPDERQPRCGRAPWLLGFIRVALVSFGLGSGARPWRQAPHVTLLAREPYRREANSGKVPVMRVMANRDELHDRIALLCAEGSPQRTTSGDAPQRCTHAVADFATLPVRAQLAMATATDVLVGAHSAALTFLIYMPSHGSVVEFSTTNDFHYDKYSGSAQTYAAHTFAHFASRDDHSLTVAAWRHTRASATCESVASSTINPSLRWTSSSPRPRYVPPLRV